MPDYRERRPHECFVANLPLTAEAIRQAIRQARCHMIERAATCVADVCLVDPRVEEVRVRVAKSGTVPGLRVAAVEIVRSRGGAAV